MVDWLCEYINVSYHTRCIRTDSPPVRMSPACKLSIRIIGLLRDRYDLLYIIEGGGGGQSGQWTPKPITPGLFGDNDASIKSVADIVT